MAEKRLPKSATIGPSDATVVGVRQLRDHLSAYLERVKSGETVTITEHGKPIARMIGSVYSPRLLELIADGTVTPASRAMPDVRALHRIKYPGSTQQLIDETRG